MFYFLLIYYDLFIYLSNEAYMENKKKQEYFFLNKLLNILRYLLQILF